MQTAAQRWKIVYNQIPLCNVPSHFAGMRNAPIPAPIPHDCPAPLPARRTTLETGIGTGYGAIFLSQRGIRTSGIDYSASIAERSRLVNNILEGKAEFHFGDLFDLYALYCQSPRLT
jgi:hypothetical protein